jgi:mannose-6-phosphate isomerase
MTSPLYPLKFQPIYKPKTWGGRSLEKLGRKLPGPADTRVGESWELTDLESSSPSGGGGGPERSVVCNGPLEGTSLHQLIRDYGSDLLGNAYRDNMVDFPLLFKILDLEELASLQVHPDTRYVQQHPDAFLKSEAWYILQARPQAVIYKGIKPGVKPREFQAAVESGKSKDVASLLINEEVRPGDCHYVPSGTLHAMGGGVLALEIQTPSDTTFRVFDWGRTGRQLHLEQAMQCTSFTPPYVSVPGQPSTREGGTSMVQQLVECEHFRIMRVRSNAGSDQAPGHAEMAVWFVLEGSGEIDPVNGAGPVSFESGETLLIPAGLDRARVRHDEQTVLLEITIP